MFSKAAENKFRKVHNDGGKKLHCSHCNGNNHTIDRCLFLIGFPPGHKLYGKAVKPSYKNKRSTVNNVNKEEAKIVPAKNIEELFTTDEIHQIKAILRGDGKNHFFANATGTSEPKCYSFATNQPNSWIIDSGATDHISSSSNLISQKNATFKFIS